MMALTIPANFKLNPPNLKPNNFHTKYKFIKLRIKSNVPKFSTHRHVSTRACGDSGGATEDKPQQSVISGTGSLPSSSSSGGNGYVGLFVRMLGLDNDPLDREQAVDALWKYSLGGKHCVDAIIQFRGSINLIVNLLKSDSNSACEAASGLLRMISSVNEYRDMVAHGGAIEGITSLLSRSSLISDVKEQSISALWNLSVDEKLGEKIASSDLLPLLIKFLEDEDVKVKESAGGVLANLALRHNNHKLMVEADVIPKMAKFLKTDSVDSKVLRKEARNLLLELSKDVYYKILIMEEGLLLVPLVGASAYKSFKPSLHSWPSLPDGTEITTTSKQPSRYGATELLIGLNIQEKEPNLEETKMKAIVGRTQQQFLARIGAIETGNSQSASSSNGGFTILPSMDGIARLVLILGLEDESAIARGAESIADACINENMRVAFLEAGTVSQLIRLLDHQGHAVRLAVMRALERLSVSNNICQIIESEGILPSLVNFLNHSEIDGRLMQMNLTILARILDPNKKMKLEFYDGPVDGSRKKYDLARASDFGGNKPARTGDLLDFAALARLVEILKVPSPELQRKAASVLEFVTVSEPTIEKIISVNIESGLDAVFQQEVLRETQLDTVCQQPELYTLKIEEAGLAISAASRLLTRLLDFEAFRKTTTPSCFTKLLREILKSNIPLQSKDWVAACLVRLSSLSAPGINLDNPINVEVTLYETVPRLMEMIKSPSLKLQETGVVELSRIVSEGVVDATRAVAIEGGIFPLVKVIDEGTEGAVEAGLLILYNLSMDPENHSAIIAAGAVPILRRIVLSGKPQWIRALRLLRNLPI